MDYDFEKTKFQAALGDFMITWNQADNAMRNLLLKMCDPSPKIHILTSGYDAEKVIIALNCLIPTLQMEEYRNAVKHLVKLYDRVRLYRNYFAHGIYKYISDGEKVSGLAQNISAKFNLKFANDVITIEQIGEMKKHCLDMRNGAYSIMDTIAPVAGSKASPPLPSPQTCALPPELKKTYSFPLKDNKEAG